MPGPAALGRRCLLRWRRPAGPDAAAALSCGGICPEGTNQIDVDFEGSIVDGTFALDGDACIAYCEPVFQCWLPNVPIIDSTTFTCEPLEGYATIPAAAEVDLGFGTLWTVVTP